MTAVTSSLSEDQQKKLLSLLGHVRLHLLYKASVHGFAALAFHNRCDRQGPTVIVAYNDAGFVFGAYTSQDYSQSGQEVHDGGAFLYSISSGGNKPLKVAGITGQCAFTDGAAGSWMLTVLRSSPTRGKASPLRLQRCMERTWPWMSLKCIELKVCGDKDGF